MSSIKELETSHDLIEFGFFQDDGNDPVFRQVFFLQPPGRSKAQALSGHQPKDCVARSTQEASLNLARKIWKNSLAENVGDRGCSPRERFETAVKSFCVDCLAEGVPICPPEDLYDQDFVTLASRALKLTRRAVSDWELVLILGWKDSGYCKMDRYELAEAVNPLLKRKLKPDTLWKYATQRLGLFSERTPGPKPRV